MQRSSDQVTVEVVDLCRGAGEKPVSVRGGTGQQTPFQLQFWLS
jgi:hypothetical protein